MEIEIFKPISNDFDYQQETIIDVFVSLIENENFYKENDFSLVLPYKYDYVKTLSPDKSLFINRTFYYMDSIHSSDSNLIITGKSLAYKANDRIINANWNRSGPVERIAYDMFNQFVVNGTHPIKYLKMGSIPNFNTESIRYQNSYGEILKKFSELCETHGFGFREVAVHQNYPNARIDIVQGEDVSDVVEFSAKFENIIGEEYENSNFDEKNVGIVLGEGEGAEREKVIVNNHIMGLERKELYVDARDLQKETDEGTYTAAEYRELLRERGRQKLAERSNILNLETSIDTRSDLFKLGKDYDLGDIVSVKSEKFGLYQKSRLISLQNTWDSNGHHVDPIFDKASPTIFDIFRRELSR